MQIVISLFQQSYAIMQDCEIFFQEIIKAITPMTMNRFAQSSYRLYE